MKKIVSSSGCSISRRSTFAPQLMRTKWRNCKTTVSQLVWRDSSTAAQSRGPRRDLIVPALCVQGKQCQDPASLQQAPACTAPGRSGTTPGRREEEEEKYIFHFSLHLGTRCLHPPCPLKLLLESPLWSPSRAPGCQFQPQHPHIHRLPPVHHLGHPTSPPAHQHKGCGCRRGAFIQRTRVQSNQTKMKEMLD